MTELLPGHLALIGQMREVERLRRVHYQAFSTYRDWAAYVELRDRLFGVVDPNKGT